MSTDTQTPVVPPVVAPAPAPAPAPVVTTTIPEPAKPVPTETDTDVDVDTGSPVLDAAIKTLVSVTGAKQADLDRSVAAAMEYNDPALIDVAFIKERFGKHAAQAVELAKAVVAQKLTAETAQYEKNRSIAFNAAGGESQWNQALSVFNSSASPTMKAAVKALMDQGNIAGGAELLVQTVSGSGLLPGASTAIHGGGNISGTSGALSAQQFKTELATLRKEAGNRSFETGPVAEKYKSLIARRGAGKQLGL